MPVAAVSNHQLFWSPLQVESNPPTWIHAGIFLENSAARKEPHNALEDLRQCVVGELAPLHSITPDIIKGPQHHDHITLAYGMTRSGFDRLRKSDAAKAARLTLRATHIDSPCHNANQRVRCNHAALDDQDNPP